MKYASIMLVLFSQWAFACTPKNMLTTTEAIVQAEAIVVATVVDYWDKEEPGFEQTVLFRIDQVLQGQMPSNTLKLSGRIEHQTVKNLGDVPYQSVRQHNSRGACGARDYAFASTYLLMLSNYTPYWAGNAPTNELITGLNDPWLIWVKGFLAGRQHQATDNHPN